MTGYRRMRRHARQARRAGMQPMMVIGSGDPLPELAAVVIARWAWRYRSELAPLGIACAVAGLRIVRARRAVLLVAAHPRRRRYRRLGARRLRCEVRPPHAARTALRGRDRARLRHLGRARRRDRPACRTAPASARHRRAWCWRSRGGRTAGAARRSAWNAPSRYGRTSPATSGWPARKSCPPRWTCGDGEPCSAWHAARPSPT